MYRKMGILFFVIDSEYIFVGSAEEWLLKVTMVPT
jgi:hypothetical protein